MGTQLDQYYIRLGVASTRANIVQVVGEVAGVAALAVGDTTSQEVKDGKVQHSTRSHTLAGTRY